MKKSRLIILVFLATLFATLIPLSAGVAYAADSYPLDNTAVLDDLAGLSINGKNFNVADYPENQAQKVQLLFLAEIGYGETSIQRDDYALYAYIYNPAKTNINAAVGQNKIQLATEYAEGRPKTFAKFELKFCNSSDDGLFYKYRILNFETPTTAQRRYDVSGIELLTAGAQNATDYNVAKKYIYEGYAKGYGAMPAAKSTLRCYDDGFNTLQLDLNHTYYRTGVSAQGAGHYNQVNTVYFSIPNEILNDYDKLQAITAEWWEYKTAPALVTSDIDIYNSFINYVGQSVPHGNNIESIPKLGILEPDTTFEPLTYKWSFNVKLYPTPYDPPNPWIVSHDVATIIPYCFYEPVISTDTLLDLFYTAPAGNVNASKVEQWIYEYASRTGTTDFINCNGRQIPAKLFERYIDAARAAAGFKKGYNKIRTNFDDTFNLKSYNSNNGWLQKLIDFGFAGLITNTNEGYDDVLPFEFLTLDKLTGTPETVSKRLLVNQNDVASIKAYQAAESLKGNTTVLFRFAATDYFSEELSFPQNSYVTSQTCFLDFDVIQLDFERNGEVYAMAAVASPIDIINDIDNPGIGKDIPQWLYILLIVLACIIGVLLIIVLWPVIKVLLKGLWWLICAPFRGIATLYNKAKKE